MMSKRLRPDEQQSVEACHLVDNAWRMLWGLLQESSSAQDIARDPTASLLVVNGAIYPRLSTDQVIDATACRQHVRGARMSFGCRVIAEPSAVWAWEWLGGKGKGGERLSPPVACTGFSMVARTHR